MKIGKWGPVVVWMAVIFFLSAQKQLPTPEQRWLDAILEKSAHTIEYAILAALLLRALEPEKRGRWRVFMLAVLGAWLYSLSDEFHQSFVPGRSADWSDIVFDWLGAGIGALVGLYLWNSRHNRILAENA
jgi:VanZ family protein